MGKQYGVLLVTGGRTHQENYAAGFAADPRCRLVGLADEEGLPAERQRWNQELAAELGIPVLPDLSTALQRDDVDLVSICSEPERRARVAAAAARAGKHVYVDKPLGGDLQQVEDLAAAVAQAGVQSHMFSLLRTDWSQRAKRVVQSGDLGDLLAFHMDLLFAKGPAGTVAEYRPRQEHYPPKRFTFVDSKREVFTTAIYSLAFMSWLTGRRFTQVQAVTANYFFAEHVRNDVEDFGVLMLTMEGGIVATVTAGRIGWSSHPHFGPIQAVLVGNKRSVKVDAYRPRLEIASDEPAWRPPRRNPDDPMGFWSSTQTAVGVLPKTDWHPIDTQPTAQRSDQSYFVDCLEAGVESDMPVSRAAHATRVIFAAYESAATNAPVTLEQ